MLNRIDIDVKPKTIRGHYNLELVVCNKYEIHYGIHQGIFEYVGQEINKDDYDELHIGMYLFKNCSTGKISFGYYGDTSPFEFTTIVKPYNR
jgi:hypothetical protein